MEATVRELNQHTAQVLARVAAGETVTVTRHGAPVATLRPYQADVSGDDDAAAYPFRIDPMGWEENVPTFSGEPDLSERVDEHLAGFGASG